MPVIPDIQNNSSMDNRCRLSETVNKLERYAEPIFNWNNRMNLEPECSKCESSTKVHIKQQRNIGIDVGKTYLGIHILELDRYRRIYSTINDKKDALKP